MASRLTWSGHPGRPSSQNPGPKKYVAIYRAQRAESFNLQGSHFPALRDVTNGKRVEGSILNVIFGRGMSVYVEGIHDRWFGVPIVLYDEKICVTVQVCSLYYHSTSPFSAFHDAVTRQDDHRLIKAEVGVCRKLCLLNPAFRGTLLTDFSLGVYSCSQLPTKGNP